MNVKRVFSFVIALTVLVTNLSCLVVVNAADKLQITVDKVEAAAGEQAVVNIKLTNNTGIVALLMDLHYGDLEFVKASFPIFDADDEDMMRSSNNKADEKRVRLNWISNTTTVTGDVTYATVTFKVPEGAANGTKYELTADIDPDNVFDKDGKNIDFDFVAGEVKVPGEPEVVDTYKCHSLDYVYAGTTKVVSDSDQIDLSSASMKKGSVVTILGWAVFSDNLKEMFYTVDGEEQACENVYRDRTEIAPYISQPAEYCVHAGFGLDNNLMDLLGTDSLDVGTYKISIGARANGGSEKILKTFTLEVVDETEPEPPAEPAITKTCFDASAITGTSISARGWTGATYPIVKFGYTVDGGEPVWSNVETQTLSESDPVLQPGNAGKYGIGFAFNINAANLDLAAGTHNFKIVVQLDDDAKTVLPLSKEINTTLNNFVITIEGEAPAAPEFIYSYYDELLYDDTQILAGSVDKKVIDPANRASLDFEKGKVSNITVRGWAQLSDNVADIKGFGYSIDGGAVVEGEFVHDRAAELAQGGYAGAQGFMVVVPVSDLAAGEHTIDAYVIAADGTQIKLLKDRSTADAQVINPIGVTFTVTEPEQPTEPAIDSINAGPALLITAAQITAESNYKSSGIDTIELFSDEGGFARITSAGDDPWIIINPVPTTDVANKYATFKYRTSSAVSLGIEVYTEIAEPHATAPSDAFQNDGQWHTVVIDLSTAQDNWQGNISRIDPMDAAGLPAGEVIDIAWIALFASEDDAKAYTGPVQFVNTYFHNGMVENNTHVTADGWTGGNYPISRFGYTVDGGAPVFSGISLTELDDSDPVKDPQNGGKYGVRFSAYFDLKDTGLAPGKHTVQIVAEFADDAKTVLPLGNVASAVKNSFEVNIEGEAHDEQETSSLRAKFLNSIWIDGELICDSSDAIAWLADNPVNGDIQSIGLRGWLVLSDGSISQIGYAVDKQNPVFMDMYLESRPDIQQLFGVDSSLANGFNIDIIDTSSLENGSHSIYVVVKTSAGNVLKIATIDFVIKRIGTVEIHSKSFDEIFVDGEHYQSGSVGQYLEVNPISGNIQTLGARGWVWIDNGTISSFGYRIDDNEPVFNTAFIWNRPDVHDTLGLTADVANGYQIDPIDVSNLPDGVYNVTLLVKTADETVLEIETFPITITDRQLAFVQSQSINTLWIDGEMIDGIGQTYIINNPINGDLKNLGVRGWAWIGNGTISQFGYKLDNGVEIFNDSFIQDRPDVQNVFGITADVANGYSINPIDVSQLENGSHTVTVLVRTASGTVIEVVTVPFSIERPEEPPYDPELSVAGCNLSFESSIYIKYAVKCNDLSKVKLLIWTEPQTQYEYGSQNYVLEAVGTEKVSGVKCAIFQYDKLAAKQMGDVIYARAVVENEGEYYYSNLKKYSVLQYVYNKTGRTGTASSNQKLIDLLNAMLDYGAKAQIYFNYKTDRLVTSDYYQISVVGGSLPDGCTSGLYALGEALTLTAPSANENGDAFSYWENDAGEVVGTTESITVTVVSLNRTYTAMYGAQIPDEPSEPEYSSGLAYSDNGDGTCTITGIGTCTDTVVDIPSEIDGLTVNAIGEKAFENQTSLTGINLPDTIKTIGRRAFYGCNGLTEFTIPNSVTSIGTQIFYKADNIETVYYNSNYYPSTETENQFLNNSSIKKIIFGGTRIGTNAARNLGFAGNVNTVEISNSVMSIGSYAFQGCTILTSVTIPDSVTRIGSDAFESCISLTDVYYSGDLEEWLRISFGYYSSNPCCYGANLYIDGELLTDAIIPDSVTVICGYAFYGCTSLTSITIPDSVTGIGEQAFYGCTSLANITIPDSVTSIGSSAFSGCTSLTSVTIPNSVTSIVGAAFSGCTSLTSITIPDSVTSIGSGAFSDCTSLTSITIPDSVTSIGGAAFYGCTSLTSVTIPDRVTSIEDSAFYGCTSLTSVTIPDSVTSIGGYAFYNCTSLTSITIPDNVTSIVDYTFYGCTSLTSITIPNSVKGIESYTFSGCTSLTDVYYDGTSEQWANVTIGAYNECLLNAVLHCIGGSDGLAYSDNGDGTCTVIGMGKCTDTVVNIPQEIGGLTVNAIGEKAFENQTALTCICIPDTVLTIGDSSFRNCSGLTSVKIPDSVTSVGWMAFGNCPALIDVYYNGTLEKWMIIYFDSSDSNPCCNGASLYINGELLTDAIVPDGVTSIGGNAFGGCISLTSVTMPDSVTSIEFAAFSGCTSITDVYYNGTLEKWLNINIASMIDSNPCCNGASLYINGDLLTDAIVPDGVTSIGGSAFEGCISLTSVTMPDSVTSIGVCAFCGCTNLTSVTMPDSVTSIELAVFGDCTSLISITIPGSVTTIDCETFAGCTNLTSVTIPDSVTSIGVSAFSDCTSLTDVYYNGTSEQWNGISISYDNDYLTNAALHCLGDE